MARCQKLGGFQSKSSRQAEEQSRVGLTDFDNKQ
jgi:hypothetical protein